MSVKLYSNSIEKAMALLDILKTKQGRIMVSIIWGLGLSCLFRQTCKGRNCIMFKAPNPLEIQKNIYRFNQQCFKYKAKATTCTSDAVPSI
jgi:hypothetical protein